MIRRALVATAVMIGITSIGSSVAAQTAEDAKPVVEVPAVAGSPLEVRDTPQTVSVLPPPGLEAPDSHGVLRRGAVAAASLMSALTGGGVLLLSLAFIVRRRRAWLAERPSQEPVVTAPEPARQHAWEAVTHNPTSLGQIRS